MSQQKTGELKKDYVYRCIMEMISSGKGQNMQFPSEPEFCRQLGVSRVTLRNALKRLENEGMITRSHYYGTRVSDSSMSKKLLLAINPAFYDHCEEKQQAMQAIESTCRNGNYRYEISSLFYLQDPEKLVEKYCGIIFAGAAIRGDESFMNVIRKSGLPAVYCREDENNVITDTIASVGVNMKKAWWAGFDYLASLGFRKIATLLSADARSFQRLGFTRESFAEKLRQEGFSEAAALVVNLPQNGVEETIRNLVVNQNPDAIYCYSDYFAIQVYQILGNMGKRIPQDISVMGFGVGSDLVTPSLASVNLSPALCGIAAVQLLMDKSVRGTPPPQLELPFTISSGDSIANIKLNGVFLNQKNK